MSSGPRLRDVCITGVCLISCLGDGADEHWQALQQPITPPVMELGRTRYLVHPAPYIDFSAQIRNPLELKRMSRTHALGAYAAGRALDSAVLKQEREMLSRAIVIVSGGGGERDVGLDEAILAEPGRLSDPALLNKELSLRTRPSLFLAQLPNLLAGNISILFGITGGSRTTMGEELAGSNAFKLGCDLVAEGSHDVALVGGAFNAERWDLLLLYGFGQFLWPNEYEPITLRCERGGGCILGTMAAFLVLEAREHAVAREAAVWCRVGGMAQRRTPRHRGDVANALNAMWHEIAPPHGDPPAAVISGASGVAPWTEEERMALTALAAAGVPLRYPGSLFGHGMEASFLFNVGLGALALRHGGVHRPQAGHPPDHCESTDIDPVLVTGIGHFGGETAALLCHA